MRRLLCVIGDSYADEELPEVQTVDALREEVLSEVYRTRRTGAGTAQDYGRAAIRPSARSEIYSILPFKAVEAAQHKAPVRR